MRDGTQPLQVKEQSFIFHPILKKDILLSLQQLHLMISANLPLQQCLHSLTLHTRNKNLSEIFQKISDSLENGLSLHASFAPYENVFGKLTLVMLELGSKSGRLAECLQALIEELSSQEQHKKDMTKALAYPCFVLLCTLISFVVLLQLVIPQFVELFEQNQITLPLSTRILIALQVFSEQYGVFVFGGLGTLILVLLFEFKSKGFLYQPMLSMMLHTPVFGRLLHRSYLYQYTFTLSTLLQSGIDLYTATTLAQSGISSDEFRGKLQQITNALINGKTFASAMQESRLFTPLSISLIEIAQQTGSLDKVLASCASHFQEQNQQSIKFIISMIEPAFTLLLGLFILTLALGIFIPIWNLS